MVTRRIRLGRVTRRLLARSVVETSSLVITYLFPGLDISPTSTSSLLFLANTRFPHLLSTKASKLGRNRCAEYADAAVMWLKRSIEGEQDMYGPAANAHIGMVKTM